MTMAKHKQPLTLTTLPLPCMLGLIQNSPIIHHKEGSRRIEYLMIASWTVRLPIVALAGDEKSDGIPSVERVLSMAHVF